MGLLDPDNTNAAGPLTEGEFLGFVDAVRNQSPREPVCPPHLVSASAKGRYDNGETIRCVECGMPLNPNRAID